MKKKIHWVGLLLLRIPFSSIVKSLRGITLDIFVGNLIFGFKHNLHLADGDQTGWKPSNYFIGSSEQMLINAVLGLF